MAYWGEAMTYHHPVWQEQDYQKGRETLERLGSSPEKRQLKAKTAMEKDLLGELRFYTGKEIKLNAIKPWCAIMKTSIKNILKMMRLILFMP